MVMAYKNVNGEKITVTVWKNSKRNLSALRTGAYP